MCRCNFSTYRTKREVLDCFVGVNDYQLVVKDHEDCHSRKESDIETG